MQQLKAWSFQPWSALPFGGWASSFCVTCLPHVTSGFMGIPTHAPGCPPWNFSQCTKTPNNFVWVHQQSRVRAGNEYSLPKVPPRVALSSGSHLNCPHMDPCSVARVCVGLCPCVLVNVGGLLNYCHGWLCRNDHGKRCLGREAASVRYILCVDPRTLPGFRLVNLSGHSPTFQVCPFPQFSIY